MRKYKWKLNLFAYYDREHIQNELEKMATKGWVPDKAGEKIWRYKKAEPRKVHVAVVYVADGSELNPSPTRGEELLEDLSSDNGWELKLRWGQMQIFYNTQENPIPLETDPVTQVESIHRAMKKNGIPHTVTTLVFGLYLSAMMVWQFVNYPIDWLSQGAWFWVLPDSILVALTSAIQLISWGLWYREARAEAQQGRFLSVWNHRILTWILTFCSWIMGVLMLLSFNGKFGFLMLCLILALGIVGFVKRMSKTMKESGASGKTNRHVMVITAVVFSVVLIAVTSFLGIKYHLTDTYRPVGTYQAANREFDVYDAPIPLRVEDLTATDQAQWSLEDITQDSFLITNSQYRQWPLTQDESAPELIYQIIEPKFHWLYDICKNGMLNKCKDRVKGGELIWTNHYEPIDPAPWGALDAYQRYLNDGLTDEYLICYENRIIMLNPSWELSTEQMAKAGEILGK